MKHHSLTAAIACIQRSVDKKFDLGIGLGDRLLFKCTADMKYFSRTTKAGKDPCVIMGRKTWESFDEKYRPLPGRANLIISSQWLDIMGRYPGVYAFKTVQEALAWAKEYHSEIWIIGGGEVYKQLLLQCDFLYLTEIRGNEPCDVFFPEFEKDFEFVKEIQKGLCDHSEVAFVTNLYRRIIKDEGPE
jgi:dihydrofolate reductase